MWQMLAQLLGGPIVNGLIEGWKAKLAADNDRDRIAAELAQRELAVEEREKELALQQNIADEGRWWTAAPRAIATWAFSIFIAKVVVWDSVLGWGVTPALKGDVGVAFTWLTAMWFGGRSAEKIARIIRR